MASARQEYDMILAQIGATFALVSFAVAIAASFYLESSDSPFCCSSDGPPKMSKVDYLVVGGFGGFFVGIFVGLIGLIWGI